MTAMALAPPRTICNECPVEGMETQKVAQRSHAGQRFAMNALLKGWKHGSSITDPWVEVFAMNALLKGWKHMVEADFNPEHTGNLRTMKRKVDLEMLEKILKVIGG